jgi:hypothetical protein
MAKWFETPGLQPHLLGDVPPGASRSGGFASAGCMRAKLLRDKQLIRKLLKLPALLLRFYHCKVRRRYRMKLRTILVSLVALGGVAALAPGAASAMPNGLPHVDGLASPAVQVRWVCNPWGRCWWRPNYYGAYGFYGGPRFFGHRGWHRGWHHGWRRW